MQAGLHAIGWGLTRLGLVAAVIVFVPALLYVLWVIAIVVVQGASALGQ